MLHKDLVLSETVDNINRKDIDYLVENKIGHRVESVELIGASNDVQVDLFVLSFMLDASVAPSPALLLDPFLLLFDFHSVGGLFQIP